jgi:hypothetical protein
MPEYPVGYQKTLIDSFFYEQDQKLLESFRKRLERLDLRAQLAKVSGIHDEAVLDRLIELNIDAEAWAAMAVVPLVFVAWADGQIQVDERRVILEAARDAGIQTQDGRYPLLEHWLDHRPSAEMLEAWKHYIESLSKQMAKEESERLKHDLLDTAHRVAQAVGGFLGLGNKISAGERAVLKELEQAFS